MKREFIFGNAVINIPKSALNFINVASAEELKFLIAAAADSQSETNDNVTSLKMNESELEAASSFWINASVIVLDNNYSSPVSKNKAINTSKLTVSPPISAKKLLPTNEFPKYTSVEITDFIKKNADTRSLIDTCQQIVGKMFNPSEINTIIGLRDYLNLDPDYILFLFAHCIKLGKKSVHYIEKIAFGLVEDGITQYSELEIYVSHIDSFRQNESQIRKMLGIGERALSAKEQSLFKKWFGEFRYNVEIIEHAFEVTVNKIGKSSVDYMGKVLANWNNSGFRTIAEIQAGDNEYKQKQEIKKYETSSFDTDEFFQAALRRSYGEK